MKQQNNLKAKAKSKSIGCSIDERLFDKMEKISSKTNIKRSELIRIGINKVVNDGANSAFAVAVIIDARNKLENSIKSNEISEKAFEELSNSLDSLVNLLGGEN